MFLPDKLKDTVSFLAAALRTCHFTVSTDPLRSTDMRSMVTPGQFVGPLASGRGPVETWAGAPGASAVSSPAERASTSVRLIGVLLEAISVRKLRLPGLAVNEPPDQQREHGLLGMQAVLRLVE